MKQMSLDKILQNMYDHKVAHIKERNMVLERRYFLDKRNQIPLGEIMAGNSYEDLFNHFKKEIRLGTAYEVSRIFGFLQEYLLFSYGHDLMFKHKINANFFSSVPIKNLIYPELQKAVKGKFNDVSVMREHPNLETNLEKIDKLVSTYTEFSTLLFCLYCHDFQFLDGWEKLFSSHYEELLDILNHTTITIGDFLHALIDYKCEIIYDVLNEIEDLNIKETYLKQLENLRAKKHETTQTFAHVHLPIGYFLNHTFLDSINEESHSLVLNNDNEPQKEKKIILNPFS